jgi:hypothetical protein
MIRLGLRCRPWRTVRRCLVSFSSSTTTPSTRSPVIGILSQPNVDHDNNGVDHNGFYIAASYVKWLEAGGARSIPIPYDATNKLFKELYAEMDGLLLPGGKAAFPPFLNYALDTIVADNRNGRVGDLFGVWIYHPVRWWSITERL